MSVKIEALTGRLNRRDLLKAGASAALASMVPGLERPAAAHEARRERADREADRRDGKIVRAAIHPAIGIARVGNSREDYFLGPEVPGGLPIAPDGYKDARGAMRRQAARFRIYGLDAQGRVVRELTGRDARIEWTVHLSNHKAAWYDFDSPLDIPEAVPTTRRNPGIQGALRDALKIDPGPRRVRGRGRSARFDSGRFLGERVDLGEIRTDEAGRLIVLGGRGHSFSPVDQPLTTFANNHGWTDDTSDGPVTARVRLGSVELPVDPAWVVVAPPNYAPALSADCCSLYDVVAQTMMDLDWITPPAQVSFLSDVFPIFERLADLQWVNQGMLDRYGWDSPEEFMSVEYLARLADPSPENAAFRQSLFARFRKPDYATIEPGVDRLPPYYGDAVTLPPETPRAYLAIQPFQYLNLMRWAAGDFVLGVAGPIASRIEDLPIGVQAAALDRAALEACLGAAFHPGCEVTWPIRIGSMYASPFRLRHADTPGRGERRRRGRRDSARERDYGNVLTPSAALSPDGPLVANWPGSLTRWMAVPWQTDTASCRSGYQYPPDPVDPYLPTFWAPRVPNHVMPMEQYERVMDGSLSTKERFDAFIDRAPFFRHIDQPGTRATLQAMLDTWDRLGVITEQPGPVDADFPAVFKVETDSGFTA